MVSLKCFVFELGKECCKFFVNFFVSKLKWCLGGYKCIFNICIWFFGRCILGKIYGWCVLGKIKCFWLCCILNEKMFVRDEMKFCF